jgi:hypothetical protein
MIATNGTARAGTHPHREVNRFEEDGNGLLLAFKRLCGIEAATEVLFMKTIQILLTGVMCLAAISGRAQFGGGAMGPGKGLSLSGSTAKLFGENKAFTGSMVLQANTPQGPVTVPGKVFFLDGKARFEMDMTETKSPAIPPEAGAQMKSMGMDKIIVISLPDKKVSYMVYPGLQAYLEMPLEESEVEKPESDSKLEETEVGKETVAEHECVKKKAVVTDKDGSKHESTVWRAVDLNKFPIKIEQTEGGNLSTMTFKEVKLSKPDAKQFDAPTDFKKCNDMTAVMQEMMKHAAASGAAPK